MNPGAIKVDKTAKNAKKIDVQYWSQLQKIRKNSRECISTLIFIRIKKISRTTTQKKSRSILIIFKFFKGYIHVGVNKKKIFLKGISVEYTHELFQNFSILKKCLRKETESVCYTARKVWKHIIFFSFLKAEHVTAGVDSDNWMLDERHHPYCRGSFYVKWALKHDYEKLGP